MTLFKNDEFNFSGFTLACALFFSIPEDLYAARLILSQSSATPDSTINIDGHGFARNEKLTLFFDNYFLIDFSAKGSGVFRNIPVKVPRSALTGSHRLTVRGLKSGDLHSSLYISTNWMQLGFDPGHTGNNPYESEIDRTNINSIYINWSHKTWAPEIYGPPVIIEDVAYQGTSIGPTGNSAIQAINKDGAQIWMTELKGVSSIHSLASASQRIITVTDNGYILGINIRNGKVSWKKRLVKAPVSFSCSSAPLISDGLVFINHKQFINGQSASSVLSAMDAKSGRLKWKIEYPENSPDRDHSGTYCPPDIASANNDIFMIKRFAGGSLCAYEKNSGKERYCTPVSVNDPTISATADAVFISSAYNNFTYTPSIIALRALDGAYMWSGTGEQGETFSRASIVNKAVITTTRNIVYAFHLDDGKLLWKHEAVESSYTQNQQPTLANGLVYLTGTHNYYQNKPTTWPALFALDTLTGEVVFERDALTWSTCPLYPSIYSPLISNGNMYVTTGCGWIFSYSLKNSQH